MEVQILQTNWALMMLHPLISGDFAVVVFWVIRVTVCEMVSDCLAVFVFACATPFVHMVASVLFCVDIFAFVVQFVCGVAFAFLISVVLHVLTGLYQKA